MSLFRLHRWLCGAIIVLAFFFLAGTDLYAQGQAYEDDKIKSVFIYNLAHFVSWPEFSVSESPADFGICLLGEDLFENTIDKVVENESAHGRPIVVQRFMALSELSANTCQILFIDRKSIDRLPDVLALTKGQMVLTVGDSRGFAEKGGMINLSREKNRIKIEINTEAVKRADLKLNSKLLQLARIVDVPPTSGGD